MKNKKLVSMVVSLALVAVVGVGATLAYFTDSQAATNTITMGHVDIDLKEPNFEGGEEGGTITGIVPGDVIAKDPTVTVESGSEDLYLRLDVTVTEGFEEILATNDDGTYKYLNNLNTADWKQVGNYFYYNKVLTAGDKVTLFDEVVIPAEWDNTVADKSFDIVVKAEAIQADNVEVTKDENGMIIGWPEAVIKEYQGTTSTPETETGVDN